MKAVLECLMDNNWDEIKLEPKTVKDKVDFMMFKGNNILKAIQVKSSENQFKCSDVKNWLSQIQGDCKDKTEDIVLYLVGDKYSKPCEEYIKNNPCIKKVSLSDLENKLVSKLVCYFGKKGMYNDLKISDLVLLEDSLFSIVHRNSTDLERIKKETIENRFQNIITSFPYKKTILKISNIFRKAPIFLMSEINIYLTLFPTFFNINGRSGYVICL